MKHRKPVLLATCADCQECEECPCGKHGYCHEHHDFVDTTKVVNMYGFCDQFNPNSDFDPDCVQEQLIYMGREESA